MRVYESGQERLQVSGRDHPPIDRWADQLLAPLSSVTITNTPTAKVSATMYPAAWAGSGDPRPTSTTKCQCTTHKGLWPWLIIQSLCINSFKVMEQPPAGGRRSGRQGTTGRVAPAFPVVGILPVEETRAPPS